MKRKLIALAVGVLAVVGVLSAAPAEAGWYYWDQSPCRSDVWWLESYSGLNYWVDGVSESQGVFLVPNGWVRNTYTQHGFECGWLGAPTGNFRSCDPWSPYGYASWQPFENGDIWLLCA